MPVSWRHECFAAVPESLRVIAEEALNHWCMKPAAMAAPLAVNEGNSHWTFTRKLQMARQRSRHVDLNYLFHRQQVERTRAETAKSEAARLAHELLASEYEQRIERLSNGDVKFPAERWHSPD
jgi:hypothetical protein